MRQLARLRARRSAPISEIRDCPHARRIWRMLRVRVRAREQRPVGEAKASSQATFAGDQGDPATPRGAGSRARWGSARASVSRRRGCLRLSGSHRSDKVRRAISHEKIIKKQSRPRVWITHLTSIVLFLAPIRLCLWYESSNGHILARDFFPQTPRYRSFPAR